MYLNQYWKDERLSFSPEENRILTLSGDFAEKIWVPDTFFANDKNRFVWKNLLLKSFYLNIYLASYTMLLNKIRWLDFMVMVPLRMEWDLLQHWHVWWICTITLWILKIVLLKLRAVSSRFLLEGHLQFRNFLLDFYCFWSCQFFLYYVTNLNQK